jgi:hypothetical protein
VAGDILISSIGIRSTNLVHFSSLFQECVGRGTPPATTVTFRESPVFCDSNTAGIEVRHVVTLGVLCKGLPVYFSGDLLFECPERDYNFEVFINKFGKTGERFACYESVNLPTGSTQNITVPAVAITTDAFWLERGDDSCFTEVVRPGTVPLTTPNPTVNPQPVASEPVAPPSVAPLPTAKAAAPNLPPSANTPTLNPTTAPITAPTSSQDSPSSLATPMPADAPIAGAVVPVNLTPSTPIGIPSEDNGPQLLGPVIGSVAAGMGIMAVIGFFLLRKKPADASPKGGVAAIPSKTFSAKDSSRFLDDALNTESTGEIEPSHVALPRPTMASLSLVRPVPAPIYNVTYKDQSRSVIEPVLPAMVSNSQEDIPFAVAVNTSAPSGTTQWAEAEPLSPDQEGLYDI